MRRVLLGVVGIAAAMMTMASMAGAADDYQKFGVRFRAIYVMPDESFDNKLSAANAKVSDDIMPELDLEYFFLKSVSTELIAGVTRNDIKLNGQFQGSTWLLPPTLTVKYHPLAGDLISPYIGFGLNVTFPFNSRLNGDNSFSIDNSVGWAAQAGADIKIKDNIYFNIDYKYINADTKVKIAGTKYDLDLNPNLFGIGIGYRF
ncbi:MAG: OmpW family outer membrane protein [Oryzomonas sp.]|uniref:OmpW/AlkL family protein n=1 Tax=Oryzomonas sp. TaxID=2855186 RepID=UPI00284A1C70|nr:OmpW family outer membrane protein [Oryzomonas sp.]MDR3580005.1 OmpW family outer membrane protein [Oryzomonas sp.]